MSNMYAVIYLTQGQEAKVDIEDISKVDGVPWYAGELRAMGIFEARHTYRIPGAGQSSTTLHRVIMCAGKGDRVTTVNGDFLDCRKANLRFLKKSNVEHITKTQ